MSCVILLAADHPMPLYDSGLCRISVSDEFTLAAPGFSVQNHAYYRDAVDALDLEMKPFLYELNLEATEEDAEQLHAYLEANCRPGEVIELWNLWVGDDREPRVPHFRGRLAHLDLEALAQLCNPPQHSGLPGQCRMTVTI